MAEVQGEGRERKVSLKVLGYGLLLGLVLGGLGGVTIAVLSGANIWIAVCVVLGALSGLALGLAVSPQVSESKSEPRERVHP